MNETSDRLQRLAMEVGRLGVRWVLTVPPPGDPEWVVRLGQIEVVADTLDGVLDLALGELS